VKNIPIYINCRDRVTCLKKLIAWLEKAEYTNITLLDNNSTYEPLLEYYKITKHKIIFLKENLGHTALWKCGIDLKDKYYVYTDPDIIPIEQCPLDAIEQFKVILDKYIPISWVQKVGFGLKIDDLPDFYKYKQQVIDHEQILWKNQIEPNVYGAAIDTTFALYMPNSKIDELYKLPNELPALRLGHPYIARHDGWYVDLDNLSDEEKYYREHLETSTHWTNLK